MISGFLPKYGENQPYFTPAFDCHFQILNWKNYKLHMNQIYHKKMFFFFDKIKKM